LSSKIGKRAEELLAKLRKYGVFVVEVGELESWLRSFGVHATKSRGVREVFKLFEQKETEPTNHGVWAFMDSVASWLTKHDMGVPR
jgi:hypothetical protein